MNKTMKFLTLAAIALSLTACGGVDPEAEPEVLSCATRAVRSNTLNTNEHSVDGGRTWLPGACGAA